MNCTNEWSMSAAAKLLGKQNRKAFSLLNLGKAILFVHRKGSYTRLSGQKQSGEKEKLETAEGILVLFIGDALLFDGASG